jgi:hypothetical protein
LSCNVFGSAAVGLVLVGHPMIGLGFAAVTILNSLLDRVLASWDIGGCTGPRQRAGGRTSDPAGAGPGDDVVVAWRRAAWGVAGLAPCRRINAEDDDETQR